jgi:hypothetical protein
MQSLRLPLIAATAICLTVTLAACGGGSKSANSSTSSASTTTTSSSTSAKAAAPAGKLQPRNLDSTGAGAANYTIADYIRDQHLTETPMHQGDPGAPQIDVPLPDGWQSAESDTPDYAYGAIVYKNPDASPSDYTPNIIALLSKLDGPADPQKLLDLAGGEMKNLPGFVAAGDGPATVSGFPAYRIAGEYDLNGGKAASGQETVVIQNANGLFVLQMNATSDESQSKALFDALESIDRTITIS